MPHGPWTLPLEISQSFKYHLHINNSHIYIFSLDFSSELQFHTYYCILTFHLKIQQVQNWKWLQIFLPPLPITLWSSPNHWVVTPFFSFSGHKSGSHPWPLFTLDGSSLDINLESGHFSPPPLLPHWSKSPWPLTQINAMAYQQRSQRFCPCCRETTK